MIAARRKLARRARRVNAELGPGGRGKDLVGKGLGFHTSTVVFFGKNNYQTTFVRFHFLFSWTGQIVFFYYFNYVCAKIFLCFTFVVIRSKCF